MISQGNTDVSVIICSYSIERWHDLCDAVRSVQAQVFKPREIIIVVDHNPQLLARAAKEFPDLFVMPNREARGLSGGRNTGIAASSGSLLAFLDDDAVADPEWLAALVRHCSDASVFGATARVEPIWMGRRLQWLPEEFLWTIGCSYRGLPTGTQEVRNVSGGASLLKRELFERVGGFAANLGRQGTRVLLSCEETELCIRARLAIPQCRFIFEPNSTVWHKIPPARVTWSYFCSRCYSEGVSKAYLNAMSGGSNVLATERTYVFRTLLSGFARGMRDALLARNAACLWRAAAILAGLSCAGAGYIRGNLTKSRTPRSTRFRSRPEQQTAGGSAFRS